MIQIDDLRLAASPSLSAAARTLNVTPPALSMRLRKLAAGLGMVLALRDARQLRLTPEGENFAREAAALLKQIEDLPGRFRIDDGRLTGVLRLAAPFGYGRCRIAPLIGRFSQAHPELQVHLTLGEAPWPERNDVDAIVHIGRRLDSADVVLLLPSRKGRPARIQALLAFLAQALRPGGN